MFRSHSPQSNIHSHMTFERKTPVHARITDTHYKVRNVDWVLLLDTNVQGSQIYASVAFMSYLTMMTSADANWVDNSRQNASSRHL